MRSFRPSVWSTLGLVAVGWGLCALGFWQVDRWQQMSAQKTDFDREINRQPQAVKSLLELDAVSPWRRVALTGSYTGQQGRVINKYIDSQLGVWLAAPFRLLDGTHLVVMRGWIPEQDRGWKPPKGEQVISGLLRNGSGDLAAHLQDDEFRSLDGYATLAHYNLNPGIGRVVIEGQKIARSEAFTKDLPRRGFYGFTIRRPHREYAGTWFGLAFALFGIWVYAGLRRGRSEDQA